MSFMKFRETGCVLHLTFATASTAYKPRLLGDVVVVPETDVKAGEKGAYLVPGAAGLVEGAPKHAHANARAWTQGELLYWDGADGKEHFSDDSSAGKKAAIAAAAVVSTATKGDVILLSGL